MEITVNNSAPVYVNFNIVGAECQATSKEEQKTVLNLLSEVQKQTKKQREVFLKFLEESKIPKTKIVAECGKFLTYKEYINEDKRKLNTINLCRERMCLNCQAALARKNAKNMMKILPKLDNLSMITLTVPNVFGKNLRETIQKMYKAQIAMFRSLKIKDFTRSTEVTYNETTHKYHPHLHVIISGTIPIKTRKAFQQEWAKWYNKQAETSHKWLSVLIQPITDTFKSSCEVSKYACKPNSVTEQTIETLYKQLKGLHLHQNNGAFKRLKNEIAKEEEQNKENDGIENIDYKIINYIFNGNNYIKAD